MFPFLNNNGYICPSFAYNFDYNTLRPPQIEVNPYIHPYMNSDFSLNHENSIPNYLANPQMPYLLDGNHCFVNQVNPTVRKNKVITKKLVPVKLKKNFRCLKAEFKAKRKTFSYFDPSRAPPITSLRNNLELSMDLKLQQVKQGFGCLNQQQSDLKLSQTQKKLQIILKQPSALDYPFLICKKRKYHRNLKRRYSVAYFDQRAVYIIKKHPIPPSLHPKNKVRKPRVPKNNNSWASESFDEQNSQEFSSVYQESQKIKGEDKKLRNGFVKAECNGIGHKNRLKQEIESELR